jgi:hypothetical protein
MARQGLGDSARTRVRCSPRFNGFPDGSGPTSNADWDTHDTAVPFGRKGTSAVWAPSRNGEKESARTRTVRDDRLTSSRSKHRNEAR